MPFPSSSSLVGDTSSSHLDVYTKLTTVTVDVISQQSLTASLPMGWTVFVTEAGTSIYSSNLSPATLATTCRRLPLTTNTASKKTNYAFLLTFTFHRKKTTRILPLFSPTTHCAQTARARRKLGSGQWHCPLPSHPH